MKMTYGQLEQTLAAHLHVHPDKVPTLRSRIKQLQRLQFPPGVNVGRGSKMEYTGEHLLMLVTVFELIGFGLPAQTAANTVSDHWAKFASGYALAALQDRRFRVKERDQVLAILWLQSLHEIQFDPKWTEVNPSSLKICDETAAKRELRPYKFDQHHTRLFLSVGKLLTRVLQIAKEQAGVADASAFDEEFHAWLPVGDANGIDFANYYPDRSNLALRKRLQQIYGKDPDSLTPQGVEEANQFLANDLSEGAPF